MDFDLAPEIAGPYTTGKEPRRLQLNATSRRSPALRTVEAVAEELRDCETLRERERASVTRYLAGAP